MAILNFSPGEKGIKITLFEMNTTELIREMYTEKELEIELNKKGFADAKTIWEKRSDTDEEIDLCECLNLSNKKELIKKSEKCRTVLQITSKEKAEKIIKKIIKIRNKIAHARDIIGDIMWEDIIDSVNYMENLIRNINEYMQKDNSKADLV
jgi:hypothetical protein